MFQLDADFVNEHRERPEPFGWNGLGEFVYYRTYAREGERWADTCERVINGMYRAQELHCEVRGRPFDADKSQRSAKEAYSLLFDLKWSPPGRGLWSMGTPFVHDRLKPEALQNCAFISTSKIAEEKGEIFRWLMEMSMLGVGVGFDTLGAGTVILSKPSGTPEVYQIPDTREGWALSVEKLFNSYVDGREVEFDYSQLRPAGAPIQGFGGTASGPAPLQLLHVSMRSVLGNGGRITSRQITDVANLVGRCVVAGNVRRSAEIALGLPNDDEFINLKNYTRNPERADWGWVSNNSVLMVPGSGYGELPDLSWANGEPGYIWLDNARAYGRMRRGPADFKDWNVAGFNPCAEQPLWNREMCTLAEIYLPRVESKLELARVIKVAYLYAKSTTLLNDYIADPKSAEVMKENRRIGLSMTGQAQYLGKCSTEQLSRLQEYGYSMVEYYDKLYSGWLGVNESIRKTTVKPSGSVSLLAGVTPGVHFPISRYYTRRVSVSSRSPLLERLESAGYHLEPSVVDPSGTVIVSFPVDAGEGVLSEREVSPWDQLHLAMANQKDWSDNGVSVTIKFDKKTFSPDDMRQLLKGAEGGMKAVSFLPLDDHGYEQAPYEEITEEAYAKMVRRLRDVGGAQLHAAHEVTDAGCDSDVCELPAG